METKPLKLLVAGSSNTDMVIRTGRLPRPGETVSGGTFFMNPGGKGANQAVAIARLGGQVVFICKTGNDLFGQQAQRLFRDEGIDTSPIFTDEHHPSGVALIMVDGQAENCIAVAGGANSHLTPADMASVADVIREADIVLMQLEIPMETVELVAGIAFRAGRKVILNPAPAQALSPKLLHQLYLITPNETEAELISGVKITGMASAEEAARAIAARGVPHVVVTLGAKGALICSDGRLELVPAVKVKAVDTTAAGDIFNGALAVALAEYRTLREAVVFASKAAALSVTRVGAQASAPRRHEVDLFH
ncbi:MAG: ribokinase [Tannerella sp.]|jgi:ribokinase|nr:ribokinase [Tannerella sp.]